MLCAFAGCDRRANHREWCMAHYSQWRRGSIMRPVKPRETFTSVADRFWSKVDKNGPVPDYRPDLGPCWIWLRCRDTLGYGKFHHNNKWRLAHIVAYEFIVGLVPEGLELDHLCRVSSCLNPSHLEAVTHQENLRRRLRLSHCRRGHLLDEANTYVYMRKRGGELVEKHQCRACGALRQAQFTAKRKAA